MYVPINPGHALTRVLTKQVGLFIVHIQYIVHVLNYRYVRMYCTACIIHTRVYLLYSCVHIAQYFITHIPYYVLYKLCYCICTVCTNALCVQYTQSKHMCIA